MKKKSNTQLNFILSDLVNSKHQQNYQSYQQKELDNLKKKCLISLNRLRQRNNLRKRLAEIYTRAKLVNKYRISQLNNVNMMFETTSTNDNNEGLHHVATQCDGCCKLNMSLSNSNQLLLQQYHKLKEFCKDLLHRYKLISELCGSYDDFNAQFTNELMLIPQKKVSSSSTTSTTTTTTTTSTTYKAIHDANNNNYNYNKSFECSNTVNNKNDDNMSISVSKRLDYDDIPVNPKQQQVHNEPTTPTPKPNPYYELENRPIRTNYDEKNPIAIFVPKRATSQKQIERKNSTNQSNLAKTSSSINSSNSDVTIMQISSTSLNVATSSTDTVDANCEISKQKSEESLVTEIAVEPPPPVEIVEKKEIEKVEDKIVEPTNNKQQDTEMVTKYDLIEPVVKTTSHQATSIVDIPAKKSSTKGQSEKKDDVPVVKGVKKTSKLKEPTHKSTTEVHVSVNTAATATSTPTTTAMSPTASTIAKAAKVKSESSSIPQSTAKPSKLPRLNTSITHASPSSLNTSSSSVTKIKEKPKDAAPTTSTSSISGKQQKTQVKRNEVREPEHHEARSKRVKKPVDYSEKGLSSKIRRDTTTK